MKLVQSTQREVVDPETGEITVIESSKTFKARVSTDTFYMTFLKTLSSYYKIANNTVKLLTWMCEHAEFNTGKVSLTTSKRREIIDSLEISNNTITNNLKKLKDANLISGDGGEFIINPEIFWKGEIKERDKLLKDKELKITFSLE